MRISRFQLIIIFSAVLVGIAGFWLWQKNSYSKEILKLEIIAPAETTMGEEITYVVKYKNNGDVRLQDPVLIFEYPAGAVPTEDQDTRITQSLDDIYPGQERNFSFSSRLFGKEGEIKEAKVLLQYTPRNLNSFDCLAEQGERTFLPGSQGRLENLSFLNLPCQRACNGNTASFCLV